MTHAHAGPIPLCVPRYIILLYYVYIIVYRVSRPCNAYTTLQRTCLTYTVGGVYTVHNTPMFSIILLILLTVLVRRRHRRRHRPVCLIIIIIIIINDATSLCYYIYCNILTSIIRHNTVN